MENRTVITEEFIQKPFILNPELESFIPDMTTEEFKELKYSIEHDGLKEPIEVMSDKTIIDGYHRYKACKELGKREWEIRFIIRTDIMNIRQAKEHSFTVNFARRHLNSYKRATFALKEYGSTCTQKELADKVNIHKDTINKIKILNDKLKSVYTDDVKKFEELTKELNSEEISYVDALKQLQTAEVIENTLATIQDDKFKAVLAEKLEPVKYDKNTAKVTKIIEKEILRYNNPEAFKKIENDYHGEIKPVLKNAVELEKKYPDKIITIEIKNKEGCKEAFTWTHEHLEKTKKPYFLVLFEIPKQVMDTLEG